jgi:hypothetical protein
VSTRPKVRRRKAHNSVIRLAMNPSMEARPKHPCFGRSVHRVPDFASDIWCSCWREKPPSSPTTAQMATYVAKENNSYAVLRSSKCLSARLRLLSQQMLWILRSNIEGGGPTAWMQEVRATQDAVAEGRMVAFLPTLDIVATRRFPLTRITTRLARTNRPTRAYQPHLIINPLLYPRNIQYFCHTQ